MQMTVCSRLAAACRGVPEREAWLERLPEAIRELQERWSLSLGAPFDNDDTSCAWVAQAMRADGTRTVLKLGMPHMEGAHELDGLRFWDGDPTVRLLEADAGLNAMLLEACAPGTSLRRSKRARTGRRHRRAAPPAVASAAIAAPFRRYRRCSNTGRRGRNLPLARWRDEGMVRAGLTLFSELGRCRARRRAAATDLHAGNVLSAQRSRGW
jgi:streptomycin 6-kinase